MDYEKIITLLKKEIRDLKKMKKENEKSLKDAHKLPNDPSLGQDIFGDGILNENPNLKSDFLQNYNHVIGYCNGAIEKIKDVIHLLSITDIQFENEQIINKKIEKANQEYFENLKKEIYKKTN